MAESSIYSYFSSLDKFILRNLIGHSGSKPQCRDEVTIV